MSLLLNILDEELLNHPEYKKIKQLKRFKHCKISKDPLTFNFRITICANSATYVNTIYQKDIVKEVTRGAAITALLKEAYEVLSSYKV